MILVIDNYDSFTYNLVQYVGEFNSELEIYRNDKISVAEVLAKKPTHIIVSPGPKTPDEAGISLELVKEVKDIPLLGVCLGHQSIAQAHGGKVIRAPYLMHGKVSQVLHNEKEIYNGIESSFTATRYHSLLVEKESLPECLEITSETEDGLIMGLRHKTKPLYGMQYHPESIRTDHGKRLIQNFLEL